ncbi:hypothetical protein [Microbacterium sp. bgisy203]|uniref:hypothetical protein n=1 Tax=Microbacterium sp. bgisy203 TaxID=3413799 RepID=UPI003D717D04
MTSPADRAIADDELAALRARAYGRSPDGALTDAEAARLSELEQRERRASPLGAGSPHSESEASEEPVADGIPSSTRGDDGAEADAEPRRASARWGRRLVWIAAGVVVVVIAAIGAYAAGVASAGPRSTAPFVDDSVTAQTVAEARARVEKQNTWDAGGVSLLAAVEGMTVWWGTQQGGEVTCISSDGFGTASLACDDTAVAKSEGLQLMWGFTQMHVDDGGGAGTESEITVTVHARPYSGSVVVTREVTAR